jgi:CHAT domain-containing protein
VDDRATEVLSVAMHRALARGDDSWVALRHAQRAVRADPTFAHPYYWAAPVAIGRQGLALRPPVGPLSLETTHEH